MYLPISSLSIDIPTFTSIVPLIQDNISDATNTNTTINAAIERLIISPEGIIESRIILIKREITNEVRVRRRAADKALTSAERFSLSNSVRRSETLPL